MMSSWFGHLEKLKIFAFENPERIEKTHLYVFRAMFNPESISWTYGSEIRKQGGFSGVASAPVFIRQIPNTLDIKLLLDGTGANTPGVRYAYDSRDQTSQPVGNQVRDFLKYCYEINTRTGRPNHLTVVWGDVNFNCFLWKLTVLNTSFDRDGRPLRAELDMSFRADDKPPAPASAQKENLVEKAQAAQRDSLRGNEQSDGRARLRSAL